MRLVNIENNEILTLGVLTEGGIIDVVESCAATGLHAPGTMHALLAHPDDGLAALQSLVNANPAVSADPVLGSAVGEAGKIICVGLNYRAHAIESGAAIPDYPVLFSKFSNTLCGPGTEVELPPVAEKYDYEVELGVLIGKEASNVSEAEALDYVFGYVTANDISVRDLQMRTSQWLLGKTLDNFLPNGPFLVTADEVPDPQALQLKTWVNGDLRQNSNTGDMIFSVAQCISYISMYFPLLPGDLIITGTPQGVAMGMPGTPWLKSGDVVEVEVEGLGKLSNTMA